MKKSERMPQPLLSNISGAPLHPKNALSLEVLFTLFLFAGVYKGWSPLAPLPDLTAVFMILTTLAAITVVYKNSLVDRRAIVLVALWMVFIIYAIISTFWSPSRLYAAEKAIKLLSIVTLSVAIPTILIARSRRRVARLLFAILAFSAIVAVAALFEFAKSPGSSLEPFGAVYLLVGRVVGLGFLISLYLTLFELRSKTNRVIGAVSTTVFVFILIASGGRGPLISAILAAVTLITIAAMTRADLSRGTILRSSLMGGGLCSFVGIGLTTQGVMPNTIRRIYYLATGQRTDSFGTRLEYYAEAVHQWVSSPIIGVGLGGWPVEAGMADARGYPHNFTLEVAAELGIIGLALFAIPLLYTLAQIRPVQKQLRSPLSALLIALFVYMLLNASVTGDITDNRYFFVIGGLFASIFNLAGSDTRWHH